MFVRLYGAAADANVRLDRNSLTLEKTFIGLMSQRYMVKDGLWSSC